MIQEICEEFSDIVTSVYGDFVHYAFLTGSCTYLPFSELEGKSDVDVVLILKNSSLTDPDLVPKRLTFNEEYLRLHEKYNLKPDLFFPGEIISMSMLEHVKNGIGFAVDGLGNLYYPKMSGTNEEWIDSPENEYKCWRSMYFNTSQEQFICGSLDDFIEDRFVVMLPLFMYLHNPVKAKTFLELEFYLTNAIITSDQSDFGHSNSINSYLFSEGGSFSSDLRNTLNYYDLLEGEDINVSMFNYLKEKLVCNLSNSPRLDYLNPFLINNWRTDE